MLFDFFKKQEKQDAVKQHFGSFQDSYTELQKKAILSGLLIIANADGEYHRKEAEFFMQTAALLGYKLQRNYLEDLLSIEPTNLTRILNNLDEGQKDWFIITIFGMIHADGKDLDVEYQYLTGIMKGMGVTRQRFDDVINKAQILAQRFL